MLIRVRRALIMALLLAPMLGIVVGAHSQDILRGKKLTVAESFVQQNIDKCYAILNDSTLSGPDRRQQFRNVLLSITDMPRIGIFALGRYAIGAPSEQIDSFKRAYTEYSVTVYQTVLDNFKGYTVQVTGSVVRSPDDVVVNAAILNSDSPNSPAIKAAFRVRTATDGRLVITDFAAEGVWLALSQRTEFSSYLEQHGGRISDLISELQQQTDALAGSRSS